MKQRTAWWWHRARRPMLIIATALLLVAQPARSAEGPPEFKTSDQKNLYFWGVTIGNELAVTGITDAKELEWVLSGIRGRVAGTSPPSTAEDQYQVNDFLMDRLKKTATAETALAAAYIKERAKEPNAVLTKSGLVYRETVKGKGAQPTRDSKVKVHYVGSLRNGWVFDSSRQRDVPFETSLNAVIGCWREAIPMMKVGGRARITCPPALGYGEGGTLTIPPGSALTFDVELLEIGK